MMDKNSPYPEHIITPNDQKRHYFLQRFSIWQIGKVLIFMIIIASVFWLLYGAAIFLNSKTSDLLQKSETNWTRKITSKLQPSDISVEGLRRLDRATVLETLRLPKGVSIVEYDPSVLYERLIAHPWVKEAQVQRQINGKLLIKIVEYIPTALMQESTDSFVVLNEESQQIDRISLARAHQVYPDFTRFAGYYAPEAYGVFLQVYPQFSTQLDKLIKARRLRLNAWTLWFERLDESQYFVTLADDPKGQGITKSLRLLIDVEQKHRLSKRAIRGVDLRHYPKMILTLSKQAQRGEEE